MIFQRSERKKGGTHYGAAFPFTLVSILFSARGAVVIRVKLL